MSTLRTVGLTLAGTALAAALAAGAVIWGGFYNVAATQSHWQTVYGVLETAMHRSVRWRAKDIEAPALDDPDFVARGARCYQAKCVQCHGGPGVAQGDIGMSMQPLPGPLVDAARKWEPRELYWITRHGIRMSGMPAWQHRLTDDDLWSLVAFLDHLPRLSPAAYAQMAGNSWTVASSSAAASSNARPAACGPSMAPASRPADVELGRAALSQYACIACHTVPGAASSSPQVGPPLGQMGRRTRIAGVLDNTPENMAQWLMHTQQVKPGTAMPEMGVTPQDALDIAAYLQTLR
ncbi:c-type cytochrome [Variovorax dokdonensis]|uniref:C-type cytochrome n=1 Tax=Variovorax dokdonensis TaxID=344883 RepID=A0ABT7N507_9BURK|nr:c-type cytochrome [Variovorax dokdonensis]MDM0043034.1 c-type cytochrome [Variovorax dokdonensis]